MLSPAGRRAHRAALTVAILAIAAGAGCSLLVTTDGLSGAADGGDGGTVVPGEASTTDVGTTPTPEAGTDAADAGTDAAVAPYCASLSPQPDFCADFDTGSLSGLGSINGPVLLDTARSKSPAGSLSSEVPAGASNRSALLQHPFNEAPAAYDLSFDVYVDTYDTTHDVELITVHFRQSATDTCVTDVSIRDNSWTIDESCGNAGGQTLGISHKSNKAVQLGQWVHVDASVSFTPTRTLSLAVDGQSLFSAVPLEAGLMTGNVTLLMGITYVTPTAAVAKVHFDNIRFDYR